MNDKTFLMELRLIDPVKIKQSIVKKILKILNSNPNLTPDNVIKYSEGGAIASILLTWIINLIKWNAGHNRFIFDDATLAGGRLMNKELIPERDLDDNPEDPFKRINAYGLMKKKDDDLIGNPEDMYNVSGEKDFFSKSMAQASNKKINDARKNRSYMEHKKAKKIKKKTTKKQDPVGGNKGKYLESKQMVFTELQMLVPSTKSNLFVPGYTTSVTHMKREDQHHDLKPVLQSA